MTETTRGAIYYNPSSGSNEPELAGELSRRGAEASLDLVALDGRVDLESDVARRLDERQRLFIAAGGDGTIHHLIQRLIGTDATLGVLPLGTFNHFARDIGIPADWREALDVAIRGEARQIDTGKVNDRYFLNNISLGLYPEMVKLREDLRATHSKWVAYPIATWMAMKTLHHISIILESPPHYDVIRTPLFFISANPYDLGRTGVLAPRRNLEGGKLTVYWMNDTSRTGLVRMMGRYFRGRLSSGKQFRLLQVPDLTLHAARRELKLGMDGELFSVKPPLRISIVPSSLLVRVPADR